jgi:hypothetical protein
MAPMTFRNVAAAAVVLLTGITAIASCSGSASTPPKPVLEPLSCSGGGVVASCLTPFGVCYEYGSDWTVPEAQSDCAIPDNRGASFRAGVPCDATDSVGVCTSVEAGEGVIATYYSLADYSPTTAEEACTAVAGTWCSPSAFGDAGMVTDSAPAVDSTMNNPLPGPDASTQAADAQPDHGSAEASRDAASDGSMTSSADSSTDAPLTDVTRPSDALTMEPATDAASIDSAVSVLDADESDLASH